VSILSLILNCAPAKLAHMGTHYYGDNLDILRWYLEDETTP
jgi:hypothetical protein